MSELKEKILEEIKTGKITPKPRWVFSAIQTLVWVSIGFSVVIGSVSVAIITFALTDADWDLYQRFHKSFLEYLIFLLPYFWIGGLVVFAILGYFAFRKTSGGYRVMPYLIVFGGLFISVVCGEMLYGLGFGESLHEFFLTKTPPYEKLVATDKIIWSDPENGLLSGRVILLPATSSFSLYDWNNNVWLVARNSSTLPWNHDGFPKNGELVKILGAPMNSSTFIATEIRPWHRPPKFIVPCVIKEICPRSKG